MLSNSAPKRQFLSETLFSSYSIVFFPSHKSLKSTISTNINSVEGPLTYQHPLSNAPAPLPAPLLSLLFALNHDPEET